MSNRIRTGLAWFTTIVGISSPMAFFGPATLCIDACANSLGTAAATVPTARALESRFQ